MTFRDQVRGAVNAVQMAAGELSTYRRGAQSVTVTVLPGLAARPDETRQAMVLQPDQQDWLLPAADLILGGVRVTPQRGDTLEVTRDGKLLKYSVLPGADQAYRLDPTGTLLRIHTTLQTRT